MREPKRIGLSLLDEELLTLINASAKIFPVTQDEIDNNLNPNGYEYAKVGRAIYIWEDNQWRYVIADDIDIAWDDIKSKPAQYTPASHTHTITEVANGEIYTKEEVDDQLDMKSDVNHNHDQFYSVIDHNHDDSYAVKQVEDDVQDIEQRLFNIENGYTEGHSHPNVDVLNSISQQQVNNWDTVLTKADKSYVDTSLASKADLTTLNGHTGNTVVHVTQTDKDNWNSKAEISDIPTSLPANGGNADTVGGYAPSAFAPSGYGLGMALSSLTLHSATTGKALETGMYYLSSAATDKPPGIIDCALWVMAYSTQWVTQVAIDWRTNKMYSRVCTNGVWSTWRSLGSGITISTTKPTDGSMWYEVIG